MIGHDRLHDLLPLYALDALDDSESCEMQRHLDYCATCLTELSGHLAVTAAMVPDRPAPDHVWARIATEISDRDGGTPGTVVPFSARRYRLVTWLGVAAVAAMVLAWVAITSQLSTDDEGGVTAAAQSAAVEPGAIVRDFIVDGRSVAEVILTSEGRGYVVPSDALEPLDASRTYQLWVITSDELVISGGVLGSEPEASAFTWTGDVSGFALTREIAGGVVTSEGDVVSVIADIA